MPKCILIADDNDFVRTVIRFFLESHQGFAVCGEAADGVDAIEKAKKLKPDLIVLDLAMSRMKRGRSGVCAEGRNAWRPDCPVHHV